MKLHVSVIAAASITLFALCGATQAAPPAGFVPINGQSSSLTGSEGLEEFFSENGKLEVTLAVAASNENMPVGKGGTLYGDPSGALEPRRVLQCLPGKQDDLSKATGKIPFFRLKPGDELKIHFINNQKTQETNLHFHGLAVSPSASFPGGGVGDYVLPPNVPGALPCGGIREYSIRISKYQKPGLYWYHAHAHTVAREQVSCGLTGPLYIEGEDAELKRVLSKSADRLQDNELKGQLTELVTPKASDADDYLKLPHSIFVLRDYVTKGTLGFEGPWEQSINGHPTYRKDDHGKATAEPPELKPYVITYSGAKGNDQLWLISNQSANLYYLIEARKGKPSYWQPLAQPAVFRVVSRDGIVNETFVQDKDIQTLFIPPGGRMTVAVHTAMFEEGTVMIAKAVDTDGDQYFDGKDPAPDSGKPSTGLGGNPYVLIECQPETHVALAATENLSPFDVLRNLKPAAQPLATSQRPEAEAVFVFDEPSDGPGFFFYNTKQVPTKKGAVVYDASELPSATLTSGKPVDWIIQNKTPEWHAFHIHQVDFKVIEYSKNDKPAGETPLDPGDHPYDKNGKPDYSGDVDVVSIPAGVQVRIRFDMREGTNHDHDPFDTIAGTFVAHCHILEHEDGGMMANIHGDGPGFSVQGGPSGARSRLSAPAPSPRSSMLMPREIRRVDPAGLTRGNGSETALNLDTLRGRYSLVTFGYTTCDGTCTGTVEKCNEALRLLGAKSAQVNPIFVSVDRVRDNPSSLAEYRTAHAMADSWRLFVDQDGQAANAFGVRTLLGKKPDGSPLVRHSAVVYLIGPDLDVLKAFYPEQDAATIVEGIRASLDDLASR